jgi:hypothetical protein
LLKAFQWLSEIFDIKFKHLYVALKPFIPLVCPTQTEYWPQICYFLISWLYFPD